MIYLYIILTLVFLMQVMTTVYFLFVISHGTSQILDVNTLVLSLRKLQEENRLFISGDHGIKFRPVFNNIVDKNRTLLKIDLVAENTKWIIEDPKVFESIKETQEENQE